MDTADNTDFAETKILYGGSYVDEDTTHGFTTPFIAMRKMGSVSKLEWLVTNKLINNTVDMNIPSSYGVTQLMFIQDQTTGQKLEESAAALVTSNPHLTSYADGKTHFKSIMVVQLDTSSGEALKVIKLNSDMDCSLEYRQPMSVFYAENLMYAKRFNDKGNIAVVTAMAPTACGSNTVIPVIFYYNFDNEN